MMHKNTAFLFPGQGSQVIGMGQDLVEEFSEAKTLFEQLDDICQKPLSKLCFEGPMDELTLTVNLQPAITAVNLACLAALRKSGITASVSAGHSLGEYAALVSAEVVSEHDALVLAKKRGELMHRESLQNPGSMAAVVGLDIAAVREIVSRAECHGVLGIANHNTAEQIVITGEQRPLAYAVDMVKKKGGKAIPLKVSGAWHCNLMKGAVPDFRHFLENVPFSAPHGTILFNATAQPEADPLKIKDIMATQLVSPVRWHDIILRMLEDGVDTFVEVGPKNVLTGLLKKTIPDGSQAKTHNVGDLGSLRLFLEAKA